MPRQIPKAIVALTVRSTWMLTAHAQVANRGLFGLRKGLTKVEAEKFAGPLQERPVGVYIVERVPRPDPDFESYGLVITPQAGLCAVLAAGKTINVDASGTQIQAAFAARKKALAQTYGEPGRVDDFIRPGSKLVKPTDWAAALAHEDRSLSAAWKLESNAAGISVLQLEATAFSPTKAYLKLIVGFDNGDGCFSELVTMRKRLPASRP